MSGVIRLRVTKIFTFDAAHFIPKYNGKCAKMHGHTYRLEVTVANVQKESASVESYPGMVMDFSELNRIVQEEVIDIVDHTVLNEVMDFTPTSENVVIHFFRLLQCRLMKIEINVERMVLWETPNSFVELLASGD